MAEKTVREQVVEALEDAATALHADRKHDGRFKHCERWGCNAARLALDRHRAEPEALLREAGQARRKEGERVRDGG